MTRVVECCTEQVPCEAGAAQGVDEGQALFGVGARSVDVAVLCKPSVLVLLRRYVRAHQRQKDERNRKAAAICVFDMAIVPRRAKD